jgi:hypothetical protein
MGDQSMSEFPTRTADTMSDAIAIASPNGRMSKRAKQAATDRLAIALFGPNSTREDFTGRVEQPSKVERLLSHAARLRDLASRGMCTRKYMRLAAEAEAEAAAILSAA